MAKIDAIDRLLTRAVENKDVPGVIVAAATANGVLCESAAGKRELGKDAAMTPDTVVWIASMTKAVTATAAMQQVERGKLKLDSPASEVLPELGKVGVLDGFDAQGKPRLRPPKTPITLKHLMTHTAGFSYDIWNPAIARYMEATGTPGIISCQNAALTTPVTFDPGTRWDYGINIDWAGKMVEKVSGESLEAYFRKHIFAPLGMSDTAFRLTPAMRSRLAGMHQRGDDGTLQAIPFELPHEPEFFMGGVGLYSTVRDYLVFTQMILGGGRFNGVEVLKRETVESMARNHIGNILVTALKTNAPALSNDAEFFPGMPKKWGLSFVINTEPAPTGRAAGSLAWAGLANTYFWIDRTKRVAGVFLTQVLPFADHKAYPLFEAFEREVYHSI